MVSPEALVSALADPERLLLFARICVAPEGLPAGEDKQAAKPAGRLIAAGLITLDENRYQAVPGVFREALARPSRQADPVEALFSQGRLVSIPRPGKGRLALLTKLAEDFEAGRIYTEKDVREKLAQVYDDHVTLRRYLVDEGLLERSNDGSAYGRPCP